MYDTLSIWPRAGEISSKVISLVCYTMEERSDRSAAIDRFLKSIRKKYDEVAVAREQQSSYQIHVEPNIFGDQVQDARISNRRADRFKYLTEPNMDSYSYFNARYYSSCQDGRVVNDGLIRWERTVSVSTENNSVRTVPIGDGSKENPYVL